MATNVLQKYADDLQKMKQEVQVSVQEYQKAYKSCQDKRKAIEVRLDEVIRERKQYHWKFFKAAKDIFLLFFRMRKSQEQILKAIAPVNEYLRCMQSEVILKEQLKEAEEEEAIAAQNFEEAKKTYSKLCSL